ncbi:MAG: glycosyltransferase [Xanthomonadales bacterium]|nr:glycosyltransferase [Xanthomonadales bacterium]
MKILHIGKYFLPFTGGIEYFMGGLIAEQCKQGHLVAAIVHHHGQAADSQISYEGADIHLMKTFGHIPFVPMSWGFPSKLKQLVQEFKPDIIHLHCPNVAAFWGLFSPAVRKIPWVVHWHSDVLDHSSPRFIKLLYPFYRKFQDAVLRQAKIIIATSPPYAVSSVPLKKYAKKLEVVPLGLDFKPFSPSSKHKSDTLKLLCIGRLTYYKGYSQLLQAVSSVVQQGLDIQLDIIGSGDLHDTLSAQVDHLGLSDRVELSGQVTDAFRDEKLRQCDILCLPSIERTEAFGLVLLEAMSAGKPCLVSDVKGSGMSWVVLEDVTGFVYQAGNSQALTRKLNEISEKIEQLPAMGLAGRQRFEALFQITVIENKISRLYRQILTKPIDR